MYCELEKKCKFFISWMWQIVHYIDMWQIVHWHSLVLAAVFFDFFILSLSTDRNSSVVQYSSWLVRAHGSNRPWVQFVFAKQEQFTLSSWYHTRRVEQLHKVSSPCLDDHQFKQEELESVEELPEVWSQTVLKCLYLTRIGRPEMLWSVSKHARAVT